MRWVISQWYQCRRIRIRENMRNLHGVNSIHPNSSYHTRAPKTHIREVPNPNLGGPVLHRTVEPERIHLLTRRICCCHLPPRRIHSQVSGNRRVSFILQPKAWPNLASGSVWRADGRVIGVEGEDTFSLEGGYNPAVRFYAKPAS